LRGKVEKKFGTFVTEKGLIGFAAERSEGVRAVVAAKVMGPFTDEIFFIHMSERG